MADRVRVLSCHAPLVEVTGPKRRPRKPTLANELRQAKKVGATSVTTADGVTFRFGETEPRDELDRELAEWEARHHGKN
jgi:hypothetical protein